MCRHSDGSKTRRAALSSLLVLLEHEYFLGIVPGDGQRLLVAPVGASESPKTIKIHLKPTPTSAIRICGFEVEFQSRATKAVVCARLYGSHGPLAAARTGARSGTELESGMPLAIYSKSTNAGNLFYKLLPFHHAFHHAHLQSKTTSSPLNQLISRFPVSSPSAGPSLLMLGPV